MATDFDLADLQLNLESAETTAWGNLGLWASAQQSYASAAEALAHRHAQMAALQPQSRVVDLGCGCGEQLKLWHEQYGVAQIMAVNLSAPQLTFARQHVTAWSGLRWLQADAVTALRQQPAASADVILAVDSAYHFSPWAEFLAQVSRVLAPGGVVVLSVLVSTGPMLGVAKRATQTMLGHSLRLAGVEPASLDITTSQRLMAQSGLKLEAAEDVSQAVLAGFPAWWWRYRREYAAAWSWRQRQRYELTAAWLQAAWRLGWPRYMLLKATK